MKERLTFLEEQLSTNPWLFGGPEEREIVKTLHSVVKELHKEFSEFTRRFQEGEG